MNIYDIAREAGVSIATISRVVNNTKPVSPEVRRRVEECLARNNYSPNAMARGLVHNSMRIIGVLVADIRHSLHADICFTAEKELCAAGYNVMLCNTGGDIAAKRQYIRMLSDKKVDGILLIGSVFSEKEVETALFDYLRQVPVIVMNSMLSISNAYSIEGDPVLALELLVGHLAGRGHRRIRFVREFETYSGERKREGFRRAMERLELPFGEDSILQGRAGFEGGAEAARRIAERRDGTTAVIFEEDSAAIGALREFRDRGMSVPGDMAVAGYDDILQGRYSVPSLTTVNTHKERIAASAAAALVDILNKRETQKRVVIPPTLVVREST